MRESEVEIGRVYAVKVSDRIRPVEILRRSPWDTYGGRPRWIGRNIKTGRDVDVTAGRCRFELEAYQREIDGRSVRRWRPIGAEVTP